ncbi:MAG: hypothetical protein FJ108_12660 [Deltaproteobacteria bacterium]|nr:hypothetical protein [Deltaproteobacteria bacterium]
MFDAGLENEASYGREVILKAFNLTEPHLRKNLDKWPDSPNEDDWATLGCAFLCGRKCKELARGGEVTPDIVESAWNTIKADTMALMERLKRRYPDKPIKGVGLGCG